MQRTAHGLRPQLEPTQASAERDSGAVVAPEPQPYEITSVHAVPYSDLFLSGSYDGTAKVWRILKEGLRSFEVIGEIGNLKGCVADIIDVEVANDRQKLVVHVLTSKENKFRRWYKVEGKRNTLVSFMVDV